MLYRITEKLHCKCNCTVVTNSFMAAFTIFCGLLLRVQELISSQIS